MSAIKSSLMHMEGQMVVSNDAPSETNKSSCWKMVQVWIKCAPSGLINSGGSSGSAIQQPSLALKDRKKHRGRPFKTTVAPPNKLISSSLTTGTASISQESHS